MSGLVSELLLAAIDLNGGQRWNRERLLFGQSCRQADISYVRSSALSSQAPLNAHNHRAATGGEAGR